MTTLTSEQRALILRTASSSFLTAPYPTNWHDLGAAEQLSFVNDHVRASLEYVNEQDIMELIDGAASVTETLVIVIGYQQQ